jgi:Tol biopolymer transport system component
VSRLRRLLAPLLVLVVLCLVCAPWAGAAALPSGPLVSFVELELLPAKKGSKLGGLLGRIATVDPNGGARSVLAGPPDLSVVPIGAPSWSGDGSAVAFAAGEEESPTRIYLADADGNHLRLLTAAGHATGPVLSPDGQWVAFERTRIRTPHLDPKDPLKFARHLYFSSTTWIVPVTGGRARRLTSWGNRRFASPSSFSADGTLLAVSVDDRRDPETVELLDVATGKVRATQVEASDAAFSPDGSRIAFSSYRDGGSPRASTGRSRWASSTSRRPTSAARTASPVHPN